MSADILLLSLEGAVTRLELYQNELFDQQRFQILGLSYDEYRRHDKKWQHDFKICVMHFTYYRAPDFDLSEFDLVVVLDEEAIDTDPNVYIDDLAKKFNNPNVRIIASGYDQTYCCDPNRVYLFPFFFQNICRSALEQICDPLVNHRKKFDVLLGMMKPHRKYIFDELAANRMLDQCYVSLTTNRFHQNLQTVYRSADLDDLEEKAIKKILQPILDSYQHVNGDGPRVSHIVPWKIYDRSLYSIVAETNWQNHWFFSEKTAKVLFAGRIFVFFGAMNSLQVLRRWGFITFDELLDETYDSISHCDERFSAAFDQVKKLYDMNPTTVYQYAERINQHNRQHIRNRSYFTKPLMSWIDQIITQSHGSLSANR